MSSSIMKYKLSYNFLSWKHANMADALRQARKLLSAKRLFSTHDFACGPTGDATGRLYYASKKALDDDQDGSHGVQIETIEPEFTER